MYKFPAAFEVPRHWNAYATILYNSQKEVPNSYPAWQTTGVYRMDQILKTTCVNEVLGQPLIEYSYKPKAGFIKGNKKHLGLNWGNFEASTQTATHFPTRHPVLSYLDSHSYSDFNYQLKGVQSAFGTNYSTNVPSVYEATIENFGVINPKYGSISDFSPQPQVHAGLLATPGMDPAANEPDFLNSSIYWQVETNCTVSFNLDSRTTFGQDAFYD